MPSPTLPPRRSGGASPPGADLLPAGEPWRPLRRGEPCRPLWWPPLAWPPMLDLHRIRAEPEAVAAALERRGAGTSEA
ncbi:MAG TPA: hypothetical protein VFW63_13190, partial [Acidimicrobiales bacterium]|nr:hypothetical protein [Acidimicrobiales bacterium]